MTVMRSDIHRVGRALIQQQKHLFSIPRHLAVACTARLHNLGRPFSTKPTSDLQPASETPLSSRWLSDARARLGHCITWGLDEAQKHEAGLILQEFASDWRALVAGSEGFLTHPDRCGLFRQKVVWGEMDSMGHVNNVVYNRYAESGRVGWVQQFAAHIDPEHRLAWTDLWKPRDEGLLLKSITTQFKFPLTFPDRVTVVHRLATPPAESADSLQTHALILSERHQRVAARVVEENVLYNYRRAARTPLQPFMRDVLCETWRLQEETRRRNTARVHGLLDRVRRLELGSWDREGAVEDCGSAR